MIPEDECKPDKTAGDMLRSATGSDIVFMGYLGDDSTRRLISVRTGKVAVAYRAKRRSYGDSVEDCVVYVMSTGLEAWRPL